MLCVLHFSVLAACLLGDSLHAAAPALDYLFPVSWQRGSNVALTLGGKFDPWPVTAWTDCPGLTFNAETNNGKLSVQIARDAPLGPHLMRVFNQDGASAPRWFILTDQHDQREQEPNDNFKQAQFIEKLPVIVTGRLEKSGDVDSFAVQVDAGKWLVARVEANSLGSPVDAVLHLLDEQGVRLAFNHDSAQGLDPLLAYRIGKSGSYILQIAGFVHPPAADVRYAGSAATIYRLTITDGPFAHHVFPVGVQRGHSVTLQWLGWNLDQAGQTREKPFDASGIADDVEQTLIAMPGVENRVPVAVGDVPEQIEIEPNDQCDQAQVVSLPCAIDGRIATAGDEDRFRFAAQKGERIEFRVQSALLGFPLDATLKIEDATGRQLEGADDSGGPDPKLTWTAPTNGSYIVAVSDLFHTGGEDFVYRLVIAPPKPDFKVATAEHAFRLEPGKTNEFKLEISRVNGHTNALAIAVEGLPEGVSARPAEVPAKGGEVKVALIATPEALPTNQPIRLLVQAADASTPKSRPALFDLRGKESRGERLINQTDQLWLTVLPKPAPPPAKTAEGKP